MKVNCPHCSTRAKKINFKYESSKIDFRTKEKIVIDDASFFECMNQECQNSWMSEAQSEYIEQEVSKRERARLNQEQIVHLRGLLPSRTKKAAAQFLGINEKAFTRWEKEGDLVLNDAYDLLLRLACRSQDNINFIKHLHEIKFAFNSSDYLHHKNAEVTPLEKVYDDSVSKRSEVAQGYAESQVVESSPLPAESNDYGYALAA